jgi:hypothetical protein
MTKRSSRVNSAKDKNGVALPGSKPAIENETVEVPDGACVTAGALLEFVIGARLG